MFVGAVELGMSGVVDKGKTTEKGCERATERERERESRTTTTRTPESEFPSSPRMHRASAKAALHRSLLTAVMPGNVDAGRYSEEFAPATHFGYPVVVTIRWCGVGVTVSLCT